MVAIWTLGVCWIMIGILPMLGINLFGIPKHIKNIGDEELEHAYRVDRGKTYLSIGIPTVLYGMFLYWYPLETIGLILVWYIIMIPGVMYASRLDKKYKKYKK